MKHTELMIDNLIAIHDGRTMRVVSLRGGYVFGAVDGYVGAIGEIYQRCQPIPITEELLAKNGFKREYDCICEYHYYIREIDDYFVEVKIGCSNMGDEYVNCHIDNCDRNSVANADIRYLHQLQNLLNIVGVEMKWKV